MIEQGDTLLLGTTITRHVDCKVEEVVLEDGHPWNDQYIKELDISRQTFIIMIKRKNRNIKPEGDTLLKPGDTVLLLTKYKSERKKTN